MRTNPLCLKLLVGAFIGLCMTSASAQRSVTYQITPAHDGATVFREGFRTPLQQIWSRKFPYETLDTLISYPIIADGKVFIAVAIPQSYTGNPFFSAKLMALSLATGKTLWSRSLTGNFPATGLAFDNGRLFVLTDIGLLRAFDPANGAVLWSRNLADAFTKHFYTPPTAASGLVFVGGDFWGGALFAVDQVTGRRVWKKTVNGGNDASPTVTRDGLFVAYPCNVYKLDPPTGKVLWHHDDGCYGGGGWTVAHHAGRVYARVHPGALVFKANSGQEIGAFRVMLAPPAFQNGVGYFVTKLDALSAWSVTTQQTLWEFKKAQKPALPPIVINGKVIVVSKDGDLFVVDGTTGAELQHISLGVHVPSALEFEASAALRRGMGAGQGILIVPAGDTLFAFKSAAD